MRTEAEVNTLDSIKLIRQYPCQDQGKFLSIFLCESTVNTNTHKILALGRQKVTLQEEAYCTLTVLNFMLLNS